MPIYGGWQLEEKCRELGHPYQYYTGHDLDFFEQRYIWLDVRVPEMLKIDPTSIWGGYIHVIVLSHDTDPNYRGRLVAYPVHVGPNTFIANRAILFNCHIGEGAVVGAGAVVCSMDVPPYTQVVGNPARVIKRYDIEARQWIKVRDAHDWNYSGGG